jgi:hypothetical protein
MKSFYKYMPFSVLKKFLDDPCLRVTPSHCQNDPFEFGYTHEDIDFLNSRDEGENLGEALKDYMSLHGIISLTTSNENITMWSHYADKHKGVVIELLVDEDAPEKLFINSTGLNTPPFNYQDFIFQPVNYSEKRGSFDISKASSLETVKEHYYFTKAKQWITEDEYRFITPMIWINKILFNSDGFARAQNILGDLANNIKCISENENTTCPMYKLDPVLIGPELIHKLWSSSNEADTMFFIHLNPDYIGRIFLGCQFDLEELRAFMNQDKFEMYSIRRHYYDILSWQSRNIEKAKIDNNKYQFYFEDINVCFC